LKIKNSFLRGLKSGIPIGLGYLSVSFSFGIMAVSKGFHWWQAVIISMVTVTSAGQLAGIGIMINPGQYMEMLISQLTVNVRYSFMAISLSQKTDSKFKGIYRWLLGFFITDEIFAVASNEDSVSRSFFTGLSLIPWLGWTTGTLTGALLGNILPDELMSALCIAIYGMFIAIIAPKAKKSLSLLIVVLIAIALSCIFFYVPMLGEISSGISISVCAILAALIGAIFFPVKEDTDNG
jgi:4-azaleucine resistance transporter AzlC